MVDTVPGDTSSTVGFSVGGPVSSTVDTGGDRDWFRISLVAGQTYTFTTGATGAGDIADTTMYLRDSAGVQLAFNDDGGPSFYSSITFTATYTGDFFLDVGGYYTTGTQSTGNFTLSATEYVPPPVYDYDQIALQLTDGYWTSNATTPHHFNVSAGGTITFNVTALTAEGQFLAREAFALWSDVTGVTFQEINTAAQITLDDADSGAYSSSNYSGGITTDSFVNVSTAWIATYGTTLNTYSFQTYIHEIGHAIGLGHGGNYNGSANYIGDALYANDAWSTTIMSYFSQTENVYFNAQGFDYNFVMTPMIADGIAVNNMYGTVTTTRTGDTTYGFNNTSGRTLYDATLFPAGAYTIYDNGGTDTLDYSGYAQNQTINLSQESFSNVGGDVGNVAIARGTVIENAIAGAGNDAVNGNEVANTLSGGAGNDTLNGGAGDDTMIGGTGDDRYIIAEAGDITTEFWNEGIDTVFTFVDNHILQNNIENLTLLEVAGVYSGTGNLLANTITGNTGNNTLDGGYGADTLLGGDGNDQLKGGLGVDSMVGGLGNDTYIVEQSGDVVVEAASEGIDTVQVNFTYALGANVENLIMFGIAAHGTGNALDNQITGNTAANLIQAGLGNDTVYGGAGSDTLRGQDGDDSISGDAGADTIDGGTGIDAMTGGLGNDVIIVRDLGDTATEAYNQGLDLVQAYIDFTLGDNIEQLTMMGTAGVGTGNALSNLLTGSFAANTLSGAAGNDTINAAGGGDVLNGDAGNDLLFGDAGADTLSGGDGGDTIRGGAGTDVATGGLGSDKFEWDDGEFGGMMATSADRITDFSHAQADKVKLDLVDANTANGATDEAFTFIGTAAFSNVAGELRYQVIGGNTIIMGDQDGNGAADFWIRIDGNVALVASDFIL